jgi:hypothetical protein
MHCLAVPLSFFRSIYESVKRWTHTCEESFLKVPTGLAWLTKPLYFGLLYGHSLINVYVAPDPRMSRENFIPLLFWVCQWKLLQVMGWKRVDKVLVSLVLDTPGLDVNVSHPVNHTNAAFFAVKYGSPSTLKYLITKRINMKQRDVFHRTCLYNALEYPDPKNVGSCSQKCNRHGNVYIHSII